MTARSEVPRDQYDFPSLADAWPATGSLKAGRAYRVTSIIDVVSKPALMHWAGWSERSAARDAARAAIRAQKTPTWTSEDRAAEMEAFYKVVTGDWIECEMDRRMGPKLAVEAISRRARDIGTQAHAAIECILRGQPVPEIPEESARCVQSYQAWAHDVSINALATERKLYSIRYRYAGTVDLVAEIDGAVALGAPERITVVIDWKSNKSRNVVRKGEKVLSGSGIYDENRIQIAAYAYAALEMGLVSELPWGICVRLPKTAEDLEATERAHGRPFELSVLSPEELAPWWRAFLAAKTLHAILRGDPGK